MSLQTLLEAAKYLDYLDSSPQAGNNKNTLGANVILASQQQQMMMMTSSKMAPMDDATSMRLNFYQQRANGVLQHPRSSPAIPVPHLASPSSMSTCSPVSAFSSSSSSSLSSSSSSYGGDCETNFQLLSQVVPSSAGSYIESPIMIAKSPLIQGSASPMSPSPTSSYSRHRELHKTLEKNRRAHLRRCFEILKAELPTSDCGGDKKTSHINIIKSAIRYVLALKRQERENDNEVQRLTKIKTQLTENLSMLRKDQVQSQLPGISSSTILASAKWVTISGGENGKS